MTLANYFLFVSIFFNVYCLKLAAERRCEESRGSISKAGINHRAMQGHSFKNYTPSKAYDCHVKCFEEKCKCQAYQITQNRCELLEEDRFSAPEDFLEEKGYTYYDMNREYVNQVTVESNMSPTLPKVDMRVIIAFRLSSVSPSQIVNKTGFNILIDRNGFKRFWKVDVLKYW